MEKYSVLMSLYYKEKPEYLRQSLDSMINQTVKPDEIVMVYDGPLTNDLYKVMEEYIEHYPKLFKIVKNKINHGLGLSLNKGLLACKNELVARMDTDDISISTRCETQLEKFKQNNSLDIIGGNIVEFVGNPNNIVGYRVVPTTYEEIENYIKVRCPFNHMTVMFKKSAVISADNYQDLFWNEDYYLWIRMLENKCYMMNTGTILVNSRVGLDMYKRRGGLRYYRSEKWLQKYMKNKKIINNNQYYKNIIKRFIVQIIVPDFMRGYIFKKFARSEKLY